MAVQAGPLSPSLAGEGRGGGSNPSLIHVLRRLELIEARVRAAVARRRTTDPETDDRFRGLYISQVHVDRLLAEKSVPAAPDAGAAKARDEIEAAADAAEKEGADLRLRRLARNFHLDEIDIELLLIAMAPDVDARFERLYGYLQDDVSRRRASVGLGLELCGLPSSGAYARSRLAAGAPLVDEYLVLVEESERPVPTRSLLVPDRVTAHLLGSDLPDAVVAALTYQCEPAPPEETATLVRWMRDESPSPLVGSQIPSPSAGYQFPSPSGGGQGGGSRLAYIRERPGASGAALASSACEQKMTCRWLPPWPPERRVSPELASSPVRSRSSSPGDCRRSAPSLRCRPWSSWSARGVGIRAGRATCPSSVRLRSPTRSNVRSSGVAISTGIRRPGSIWRAPWRSSG